VAAALTLSPARALRRPRRVDARALAGILVTLVAFGASLAYWTSSSTQRGVVIATRELPAGAALSASDLTVTQLHADDAVYEAAIPADELEALVGRQLTEPIHPQQILARAQVAATSQLAPDQLAYTIPARPDAAVGGRLHVGDAVRVLATTVDKTDDTANSRVVVDRAVVFDVGRDTTGTFDGPVGGASDAPDRGTITSVTLAVSLDQAQQLAEARRTGELDIALLPPPPPVARDQ
jgi:Flp pilus assembly protein CpaB